MITKWDDYFIHQTPQPILQPFTNDPDWIDRFWWGAVTEDASSYIAVSLGQYRSTMRMDAIVYAIQADSHRILKLAKNLSPENFTSPSIGPLHFDIVEPLEHWTWRLADNPTGVTWDLDFRGGRKLCDYKQFRFGTDPAESSDYRHMVQTGLSTGELHIGDSPVPFGHLQTIRDRSWGIRRSRERLGMFIWINHRFTSCDISLIYNEHRDGSISYLDGVVTDDEGQHRVIEVGHELKLSTGRDVQGGTVALIDEHGRHYQVHHERVLKGFPGPVGYGGWAGKDHSDMQEADGYYFEASELDVCRSPADIIAEAPIHIFEHPSRIWLDGGEETVGIMAGGVTRSSTFEYAAKPLRGAPNNDQ